MSNADSKSNIESALRYLSLISRSDKSSGDIAKIKCAEASLNAALAHLDAERRGLNE